jgi:hypothetical protein
MRIDNFYYLKRIGSLSNFLSATHTYFAPMIQTYATLINKTIFFTTKKKSILKQYDLINASAVVLDLLEFHKTSLCNHIVLLNKE